MSIPSMFPTLPVPVDISTMTTTTRWETAACFLVRFLAVARLETENVEHCDTQMETNSNDRPVTKYHRWTSSISSQIVQNEALIRSTGSNATTAALNELLFTLIYIQWTIN